MNKRSRIIGLGIVLISLVLLIGSYFILTDSFTNAKFRTTLDPIPASEKVNLTGLRELNISGGPYVNFSELKELLSPLHKHVIIVDTMGDYTGNNGYIDEVQTTYFGYHRPDPDWRYLVRRLLYTGTTEVKKDKIVSERDLAKKYGFDYVNIRINSKMSTSDKVVDQFVAFVDSLPQDAWVHFHCRLGKGRTSIMLNLFDIMKNAPKGVPFEDIIKRQYVLGSRDLLDTAVWKVGSSYSSTALEQRKQLLIDFYDFILQRSNGGIHRWSDWRQAKLENQGIESAKTLNWKSQ